ncbi:SsrA-binding protein [Candidatus Marinamargulisbacteria bacterium SCGC AG-439-L15]|nr:SsrA-binding protein [Candidatus Marinamargulisbacteria bacterium SCGC AG-439-L15]
MSKKKTSLAINKRATHDYLIIEKIEAGVVLEGCEVKSFRTSHVTLKESYAKVFDNELWLFNCYVAPYPQASGNIPEPYRNRKLLLHSKEIKRLISKIETKGYILVPYRAYLSKGRVKIELILGQPKKLHDKRHAIKEREIKREIDRSTKNRY